MKKFLQINKKDNVAVALTPLQAGEMIQTATDSFALHTEVPSGHKFTLCALAEGENVIKYGYPIGHVTRSVEKGVWIDENTIHTNLSGLLEYRYNPVEYHSDIAFENRTFMGYRRRNGDVGIRNSIWIIPTVGCVNGIVNSLAKTFNEKYLANYTHIDSVEAYTHNYGCSQLGSDHENTRKILRDIVLHPNAGGVLVVGLGCENNQPDKFRELLGDYDTDRIKFLVTQKSTDELADGMKLLTEIAEQCNQDTRESVPLSELRVGLKCGGSDGFSGITANPLLGLFSDWLVAQGGTTVLTEIPEAFGAETILMNRCETEELYQQVVKLINDFKQYYLDHGEPVGENPSPGNKAGGISTLEEKSLGCVQKCGDSIVHGVLRYGDRLQHKGLNVLSAPGNDLVASTALASCGCHIVLFTTGRGTPFGTFVPTVKISTNSNLYKNKRNWIDFNAGELLEDVPHDVILRNFIDKIISYANGEQSLNEKNNYKEISIFKNGVTL